MTSELARKMLLLNGVKNLQEFGYPDVNLDNILTDEVYSMTFKGILEAWKDREHEEIEDVKQQRHQNLIDVELEKLLTELQ